ncbi:hypothetical protein [Dysgonomonas sp. HGC4]|uniref:hypothetical protein n=1 Tax=Dysgonomonas sp. HGC4 TaxID=1658009 RepID=UPI000681B296|nr:hypothetical protein [Dysgonomonas sp. HGC4]MBD8349363.1 hypothetical protein [Dysgonomonas sp. HGC4]
MKKINIKIDPTAWIKLTDGVKNAIGAFSKAAFEFNKICIETTKLMEEEKKRIDKQKPPIGICSKQSMDHITFFNGCEMSISKYVSGMVDGKGFTAPSIYTVNDMRNEMLYSGRSFGKRFLYDRISCLREIDAFRKQCKDMLLSNSIFTDICTESINEYKECLCGGTPLHEILKKNLKIYLIKQNLSRSINKLLESRSENEKRKRYIYGDWVRVNELKRNKF